ncbi:MAG TPA: DGQHR domain-containing protein [Acidimicrobiia bacterium]|nr:DGQHR domain-containing protein [Acidimicrobiia bacterium]
MPITFPCVTAQDSPQILTAIIPGPWLLGQTTPTWRIKDPKLGFQRMVNEDRAKAIAVAVLDQQRTFPNAIVLATDINVNKPSQSKVTLPNNVRFLVVDGQHRLWAQNFSTFEAPYICVIHFGLKEREMAELFIEINDNQKRVPSSLRWDLFRLVRPGDEPNAVRTADLVYDLASSKKSALYQRIDLTGEQPKIDLKQGSVAPAINSLISSSKSPLHDIGYDVQLKVLMDYVAAMKECDPDAWNSGDSPLYSARVFRAALRLLPELINALKKPPSNCIASDYYNYLRKIDLNSLDSNEIKAQQGSAGIKAIYLTIQAQVFKKKR